MLKQQKMMIEEHQKLIKDLWTKKEDAQNKHLNAEESEGNSLAKKKRMENESKKSKSRIPV